MTGEKNSAPPGLVGLIFLLVLAGFIFAAIGVWLILRQFILYGLLALIIGVISSMAAWGLHRRKRWGVVLFGLLGLAGSINHLAGALNRNANISWSDPVQVIVALFSLGLAILIAIGLSYIVLLLWRRL